MIEEVHEVCMSLSRMLGVGGFGGKAGNGVFMNHLIAVDLHFQVHALAMAVD